MYLVNLSQDRSDNNMYLSNTLLKEVKNTLDENRKVILYLNKRWEYSSLVCTNCNHLYKCRNCDVSLNVHNNPPSLICHICSSASKLENKCEKCAKNTLRKVGVWTQQIESSLRLLFPEKNIFRFDTDTVKNKTLKNEALEKIESSDIIIGTKMITTGFNIKNLWLIWVILLEQELLIPKYNTEEKVYFNIKQLLWRWNRVWEETNIVIQSFIPENNIIKSITEENYKDFFLKTLEERKLFNYPPFKELVILEYRHKSKDKAKSFLENLYNKLQINNTDNKIELIFVDSATKKYNQFYYKIIIKWDKLRDYLKHIKLEIIRNSNLSVIFN